MAVVACRAYRGLIRCESRPRPRPRPRRRWMIPAF